MPPAREVDDDDMADDTTLLNGTKSNGSSGSIPSSHKWPWVLLGVFLGLLTVLVMPQSGSASAARMMAGAGSSSAGAQTCGAVPSPPPPLVKRVQTGRVRNVLVTGGAGFIASHFALALIDRKGFNVTIVDDLSRGSIETVLRLQALAEAAGEPLNWERLDVNEEHKMAALLARNQIEVVVHFSGNAYVGESMIYPEDYYQNITVRAHMHHRRRRRGHFFSAAAARARTHATTAARANARHAAPAVLAGVDRLPRARDEPRRRRAPHLLLLLRHLRLAHHLPHH